MEIRNAQRGDLPRIAALFWQLGYPNTTASLERRWPEFERHDGDCWVAEVAGQIVGVITQNYILPLSTTNEYAVVTAFVVDEALRRLGAGRALMAHAEARAQARGCTHTELSSSMRRQPAHLFYEQVGYREVPKRFVKDYAPRAAAPEDML